MTTQADINSELVTEWSQIKPVDVIPPLRVCFVTIPNPVKYHQPTDTRNLEQHIFSGVTSCKCRGCQIEAEYVNTKIASTNYYGNSDNSDIKIRHFGLHLPFPLEEKNSFISFILIIMKIF